MCTFFMQSFRKFYLHFTHFYVVIFITLYFYLVRCGPPSLLRHRAVQAHMYVVFITMYKKSSKSYPQALLLFLCFYAPFLLEVLLN